MSCGFSLICSEGQGKHENMLICEWQVINLSGQQQCYLLMASQVPFLGTQCSLSFLTLLCIMGTLVHRISKHQMAQQQPGHTRRDFVWLLMACLKVILGKNMLCRKPPSDIGIRDVMTISSFWHHLLKYLIGWLQTKKPE